MRVLISDFCKELNSSFLRDEMIAITEGIIGWIYSREKDSNVIFLLI